jgi:hypothetical protein
VPAILSLLEPGTLEQPTPRRLPAFFVPNLIGEYLLERPLRAYFDPFVLVWLAGLIVMAVFQAPTLAFLAVAALLAARLLGPTLRLARHVREDYLLLRDGLLVTAHVLGVRPALVGAEAAQGAYLYCAIPITGRRTSVGSVWLPDRAEALRLSTAGRVAVICMARAPGIWRLRDSDGPHLRYESARG